MSTQTNITIQNVLKAHTRIRQFVRHTPLEHSINLSRQANAKVYLKMENLQFSGSFKPRGSFNRLCKLNEVERLRGVIAPTAGNHGIGLSYAAAQLGVPAHIYLPKSADPAKIAMLPAYGAKIRYFETVKDARMEARRVALEEGLSFLSAYNDESMIEGGGTVALEILSDMPDVEVVVVCLGGGGLLSGIGIAIKAINPAIQVWGVQATNYAKMARWYEAGEVVPIEIQTTIAEGLSVDLETDVITFPIIQQVVDKIVTVSEEELIQAMKWMLDNHQHVIEPSGGAAIAVVLQNHKQLIGRKVVATITGRNISRSRLLSLIA